jgi:hypothetical protein
MCEMYSTYLPGLPIVGKRTVVVHQPTLVHFAVGNFERHSSNFDGDRRLSSRVDEDGGVPP